MGSLTHVVAGSPLSYLVVLAAVLFDGLVPLVPSEATIITASVLAARGSLSIVLILLASVLGAAAGDNVSYLLGRGLGQRAASRLFRGAKGRRRLERAGKMIQGWPWIVTVGRFLPGGRTAATFAAGMLGMPWRRFIVLDASGAALWAVYSASLGYLGGEAFRHAFWKSLAVSLAAGIVMAAALEIGRRLARRRGGRAVSDLTVAERGRRPGRVRAPSAGR